MLKYTKLLIITLIITLIIILLILIFVPEIKNYYFDRLESNVKISKDYILTIKKEKQLINYFNYNIDKKVIPLVILKEFPTDFNKSKNRKKVFIKIILPQILYINKKILNDRNLIKKLFINNKVRVNLTNTEKNWLANIANLYNVKPVNKKNLLLKINTIPPSLAIAQSAIESGWGTSRFTIEGNALYGQRTFDRERSGFFPSGIKSQKFKVQKFNSLLDSTWAYTLTINSHAAYERFRSERLNLSKNNQEYKGIKLSIYLDKYSEKGEEYTKIIKKVILTNNLNLLNSTELK